MRPAARPVGLLFGVSLALVILLFGPLLLFNPAFTSALQERHAVAQTFDRTQEAVDAVTAELLRDIYLDGPFTAGFDGQPLLDESERSHMSDVSALVRLLAVIAILALVAAFGAGWWLRAEPARQGTIMMMTAGAIGTTAVALGLFFALAFDTAFTLFHTLFFPPGTWQFAPGSNLITLFPEPFWFDAAIIAGATIVLGAVIVSLIGLWRWRSASGDADPGLI
jgi:integral membrane protein (TIGR01906 family)